MAGQSKASETVAKRGRGRPKGSTNKQTKSSASAAEALVEPRKRGRPRKQVESTETAKPASTRKAAAAATPAKKRGRPRKQQDTESDQDAPKKRGRPRKQPDADSDQDAPKKRGRPRKQPAGDSDQDAPKTTRGRPRKQPAAKSAKAKKEVWTFAAPPLPVHTTKRGSNLTYHVDIDPRSAADTALAVASRRATSAPKKRGRPRKAPEEAAKKPVKLLGGKPKRLPKIWLPPGPLSPEHIQRLSESFLEEYQPTVPGQLVIGDVSLPMKRGRPKKQPADDSAGEPAKKKRGRPKGSKNRSA
ncbi:hypothetical protein IWW55_000003 [Coemansia sp. RSA 2706]|nr:hypothetical protein LPJ63_001586 [Coemansia sp. RSA 2711]KAJ1850051.1 hypothetical protein LPJ70_000051 [Coemansia sp. RSA 2708]KAJ2309032.1 hypothetical protein IWW55_000003 [Coemansia sp. RSA 2706]KAJ2315761.1 hypothetical protein IWW54_000002 [Coemansia sp. RSA 2705]KAJ2322469.1 hypothetical protein IWW52_000004 [Coemansia sp. RSA 2704]KAJ2330248.1 hypothetical protein IWW51_000003 [Coemansia sp. RSA 2702]KAJ2388477.1 hypothetical protein H4S02_002850 [Coemansia sp. RSA 2611]KAJ274004